MNAPNGTVVTFVFDTPGTNHTVAQSTFANPCEPLEGGFNSGFFFVNSSSGPFGTWTLTVTDVNTREYPARALYPALGASS